MYFASDNAVGASPEVMEAIVRANEGPQPSYGGDEHTKRAETMFSELFERDVTALLMTTGTAANALGLASITPSYRAVLCHTDSHVMVDECAATEFYTGGAKLLPIWGNDGKITPGGLKNKVASAGVRPPHDIIPASMSLTQATESGTLYSLSELGHLTEIARDHGLKVHMDGARFANAIAALGCSPAEMTWKAGIDTLTFGITKNGAIAGDAIVFFDADLAESAPFRRMQAGHLWSKGRYLGAQFCAMLEGDLWLENARHANRMAQVLAEGLDALPGVRLAAPCQANEVFPVLPGTLHAALQDAGAVYYEWPGVPPKGEGSIADDEVLVRFVLSFKTDPDEVERLLQVARDATG
ncbi:MAG: threonine aldolase family protein [Hyphomicrobiales bacterium]